VHIGFVQDMQKTKEIDPDLDHARYVSVLRKFIKVVIMEGMSCD
jgi:hypothetical protein